MAITPTQTPLEPNGPAVCPLPDMGFVEVAGADAEAFLNAQLSRNVKTGPPTPATLAGWHDARGRVLALPWALWTSHRWLLLIRGADTDALVRRMKLFVLRDEVRVRNASANWEAVAVVGSTSSWTAPPFNELGHQRGDVASNEDGTHAIRIGTRLAYAVAPRGGLQTLRDPFIEASAETASAEEIRLGMVNLEPGLAGRFTAHMLNLDLLEAVSFDKGCYPGQEIIARTQNLGSAKRRVFLYGGTLGHAPAVGTALLDADGDSVGEVVRAATASESWVRLLAVVRVDAASSVLTCSADASVPLTREALPWE